MPAFDEEAFQQWSKRKLDQAVEELIQYKVFDTPAIQARVVWGGSPITCCWRRYRKAVMGGIFGG